MHKQALPFNMGPSTKHIYTDSYISISNLMCMNARLHCTTACKFVLPMLVPGHIWTRMHVQVPLPSSKHMSRMQDIESESIRTAPGPTSKEGYPSPSTNWRLVVRGQLLFSGFSKRSPGHSTQARCVQLIQVGGLHLDLEYPMWILKGILLCTHEPVSSKEGHFSDMSAEHSEHNTYTFIYGYINISANIRISHFMCP